MGLYTDSLSNSVKSAMKSNNAIQSATDFTPIEALNRSDADLLIIFLSGNGVYFMSQLEDDWYRATDGSPYAMTSWLEYLYQPVEAASPLGCLQQWQWCNSAYAKSDGCGPLTNLADSFTGAAPLFNLTEEDFASDRPVSSDEAGARLIWALLNVYSSSANLYGIIQELGAKALASQSLLYGGVQWPLPNNQWQLDVISWRNILFAMLQDQFVQAALGDTGSEQVFTPLNDQERHICDNQVR